MDRMPEDEASKMGGGLKDRPLCERCGRPVKIGTDDYMREEILCLSCASDARATALDEFDYDTGI